MFVTRNMWHSCSNRTLAEHFRGKPAGLRALYDAYLRALRRFGPVTVIPQKTRVSFQARVRFAGCAVLKDRLRGGLWLKRRVADPRFTKVEHVGGRDWVYTFFLRRREDLDGTLLAYLREAYAVGRQES
jgi:hypothetical protein